MTCTSGSAYPTEGPTRSSSSRHYHPDQAGSSNKDAAEAFRKIREAYEILSEAEHRRLYDKDGKEYFTRRDNAFYSNVDPRRVAFLQMLRGSLPFFLVGCVIFTVIVARRNRAAFQSAYFSHLLVIFAVIQVFPRILAAILLFAVHSSDLAEILSASEKSNGSLIVTLPTEKSTSLFVRPEGLSSAALSHADKLLTTLVVSTTDSSGATTATSVQFRNSGKTVTAPRIRDATYKITVYDEERGLTVLDSSFAVDK